jgi:hypothetical protein
MPLVAFLPARRGVLPWRPISARFARRAIRASVFRTRRAIVPLRPFRPRAIVATVVLSWWSIFPRRPIARSRGLTFRSRIVPTTWPVVPAWPLILLFGARARLSCVSIARGTLVPLRAVAALISAAARAAMVGASGWGIRSCGPATRLPRRARLLVRWRTIVPLSAIESFLAPSGVPRLLGIDERLARIAMRAAWTPVTSASLAALGTRP